MSTPPTSSASSSSLARIAARARARLSSPDATALLLLATAALIIGFGASVKHVASGSGHDATSLTALADAAAAVAKTAHPTPTLAGGHGAHAPPGPEEACADALAIPKVALMFLTRAGLYHESAWAAWFRTAEGLIPHPALWSTNDSAAIGADGGAALFSVYVHAAPDYEGFKPGSIFAGTLIGTRIAASWGGHDLVDVTRALLKAALADARNARFALLSESGVPIYPAPVVWAALTQNPLSRINACVNPWNDEQRWHPDFGAGGPGVKADGTGAAPLAPPLPKSAWRKSSQWSVLTRAHAELVVADTAVDSLFRAICRSRDWDDALGRRYDCYSDEHYIPTLLATVGADNETDCLGFYINVDWSKGGAHPRTYGVDDVRPRLFGALREAWGDCDPGAAIALGRSVFGPPATLLGPRGAGDGCSAAPAGWSLRMLPKACPLFARKFPAETAGTMAAALTDCGSGVVPGESGCVVGGWKKWEAAHGPKQRVGG